MGGPQNCGRGTIGIGISILLSRKKTAQSNVRQVYSPPPGIRGKAGAVWIAATDHCVICAYLLVNNPKAKHITKKVLLWVEELVARLPHRCIPILLADANARVGEPASGQSDMRAVGGVEPDRENAKSAFLRQPLQYHHLCAYNTYFHGDAKSSSRVDYIIGPDNM